MADPRNIAHDKKVMSDKEHHGEPSGPADAIHTPQPGKKTPVEHETHAEKKAAAKDKVGDDDAAE